LHLGSKRRETKNASLHSYLSVSFGRVRGHLKLIFISDIGQSPTLMNFYVVAMNSQEMDQLPDLLDALLGARSKPEYRPTR
jgi:hypothetical protein